MKSDEETSKVKFIASDKKIVTCQFCGKCTSYLEYGLYITSIGNPAVNKIAQDQ